MAVPYRPKPTYPQQQRPQQGPQSKQQSEHRINNQITAPQVRVVSDELEGAQVMSIKEAILLADQMELDLIEISPKADPPVCRIADYQKFLYQQKKKAKEIKAKQAKVVIKEIRFGPQTDDHDYNFKLRHAQNFLQEGFASSSKRSLLSSFKNAFSILNIRSSSSNCFTCSALVSTGLSMGRVEDFFSGFSNVFLRPFL
ncbi:MAG: translation initiation factor IF-3 [Tidjanibacter sp.]|nr:translation initiation factor IF-3 [Tidjanibacter sp.]